MSRSVHRGIHPVFAGCFIEARRSARLTQAQLAERLGRPQSFVSSYETGERRLTWWSSGVGQVLGIDPVELLREVQINYSTRPRRRSSRTVRYSPCSFGIALAIIPIRDTTPRPKGRTLPDTAELLESRRDCVPQGMDARAWRGSVHLVRRTQALSPHPYRIRTGVTDVRP